jgi:hypothetical protein
MMCSIFHLEYVSRPKLVPKLGGIDHDGVEVSSSNERQVDGRS